MSPRTRKPKIETPVDELSFEAAFEELEAIVAQLEAGRASLEEALTLFERGQALAARCGQLLDGAALKVKVLQPGSEGGRLADFEPDEAED